MTNPSRQPWDEVDTIPQILRWVIYKSWLSTYICGVLDYVMAISLYRYMFLWFSSGKYIWTKGGVSCPWKKALMMTNLILQQTSVVWGLSNWWDPLLSAMKPLRGFAYFMPLCPWQTSFSVCWHRNWIPYADFVMYSISIYPQYISTGW